MEKEFKTPKTPVMISRESRADLRKLVEDYQKDFPLRVTQQFVVEDLIEREMKNRKLRSGKL